MNKEKINLFGIPVNRLTKEELPFELDNQIQEYQKDLRPRFATAINAFFLSYVYGITLSKPSNPELLQILRNIDMITVYSEWLAFFVRLLGSNLPALISSENLLQAIAELSSKKHYSIYLLGGNEKVTEQAVEMLKASYPSLKIVGSATPLIFTKGERLEESQERDRYIIEKINHLKPDVLILQLGHPKQEIWFERVKHLLKVPLTVGVGGAFERYIAQGAYVPKWAEELKIQDTYKEFLKPFISFFKHSLDVIKYFFWLVPLFLYNLINRFVAKYFYRKKDGGRRYFFLSSNRSITVIPFPTFFSDSAEKKVYHWMEDTVEEDYIVLDFLHLRHLDLKGIGFLMDTLRGARHLGKKIFFLNINADLEFLLKLQGVFNDFQPHICADPKDVLLRIASAGKGPLSYLDFYESIYQEQNEVVVSFFGDLNLMNEQMPILEKLRPILDGKRCLINFTYCTGINNLGIGFLLKLLNVQKAKGLPLKITGLNPTVYKQISLAKVLNLFKII